MTKNLLLFFILVLSFGTTQSFAQSNEDTTFHKTFIDNNENLSLSLVEFKQSGIYIEGKKKAYIKSSFDSFVFAGLNTTDGRIFVFVSEISQGTCGYNTFIIVEIDSFANVKVSKDSPVKCSGEAPSIKLEMKGNRENFYQTISVGNLEYNLGNQKWSDLSGKKSAK